MYYRGHPYAQAFPHAKPYYTPGTASLSHRSSALQPLRRNQSQSQNQNQNQNQYPIASVSTRYSARAPASVTDENTRPTPDRDATRRCPKCNEQVKLKSWNRHKNYTCRVEPLKQSICPNCSMMFSRPDSLTRHLEDSQDRCLENQAKRDAGTLRTEVRHRSKRRTSQSSCDDVTNSTPDATTVLAPTQPYLPSSNNTVNSVVPSLPANDTPAPGPTESSNSIPVWPELPVSYAPQPITEALPVYAPSSSPVFASASTTVTTTAILPSASLDDDPVIPSSTSSLPAVFLPTIPYIPYNPLFAKEEEAFTDADFDCFK